MGYLHRAYARKVAGRDIVVARWMACGGRGFAAHRQGASVLSSRYG
jgi:hypothetical protein